MIANEWSDEQTYAYVNGCLFGTAAKWIRHSKVEKENTQDTWTWLKPQFRKRFFHKINQTAIADALKSIRNYEDFRTFDPHDAFTELMDAFDIIEEYLPLPAGLQHAPNTHYTNVDVKNAYMKVRQDMLNQFRRNIYLNMMPAMFRNKVMDKNKEKITDMLEEAVKIRDARDSSMKSVIAEVQETEATEDDNENQEIDAIRFNHRQRSLNRPQPNLRPQQGGQFKQQQRPAQTQQRQNQPRQQGKPQIRCAYCQKLAHNAEECRKRIADNAPCVSNRGVEYYPERRNNRQNNQANNRQSATSSNNRQYNFATEDFLAWV